MRQFIQRLMHRRVSRIGTAFGITLLAITLSIPVAFGDSPHFVSTSVSGPNSSGQLVVSFKEAGLGDNQLISYVASADGTASYACVNGGGNHPKATNKETVKGPVSASGTFSSGKNGTISQSLTMDPPSAGSFSCPSGQSLVLAFASFTNVSISDTTNGVAASFSGTFSACLFPGIGIC
jgi:hypothetical protein